MPSDPKERPAVISIMAGRTKHNTAWIVGEAEAERKRFAKLAAQAEKMGHKLAHVNGGFRLSGGTHNTHFDDLDEMAKLIRRMARKQAHAQLNRRRAVASMTILATQNR